MFTIDQIKQAHSRVKSGADFPKYIQDIKKLGVTGYVQYVSDGHTEYSGNDTPTLSPAKYDAKTVVIISDKVALENALKIHQAGQTDYMTFCSQAAEAGVNKWVVDVDAMTCTYLDINNNSLLIERIPV